MAKTSVPCQQQAIHVMPRSTSTPSSLYHYLFFLTTATVLLAASLFSHYQTSHHTSTASRSDQLHLDYSTRLADALKRGRQKPQQQYIVWLHVPKTGTSFINTLIRWGCPTAGRDVFIIPKAQRPANMSHLTLPYTHNWHWLMLTTAGRYWVRQHCEGRLIKHNQSSLRMHMPLRKHEMHLAVALFRSPLQRIYSSYKHVSQHYNSSRPPIVSLRAFVSDAQFRSQHAKLLLGRPYRDARAVTEAEAREAGDVVNRLAFVGLTEHFALSCRLFHARFGGVPHRAQFENVRPATGRVHSATRRDETFRYDESVFQGWRDFADEIVYEAARRRFWTDVETFKAAIEVDGLGDVQMLPDSS